MNPIPHNATPRGKDFAEPGQLPVIVQYWHESPPPEILELMDTWRRATDEGFEYHAFNDVSAREFIRQHYDERAEKAFLSCAVPAMRADFFRICALLLRPGIYADADMRRAGASCKYRTKDESGSALLPLYLRLERGLLFQREIRIANGFIIVRRAHDPLLLAILQRAIENIEKRISNNVYLVTGPGIATRWLKDFGRDHEYFRGFEFWSQEDLLPYMRMVGKLPYKQTDDHWVNAQQTRRIFADLHVSDDRVET
jgi:mannosyltransferase OCH1-like enzyme